MTKFLPIFSMIAVLSLTSCTTEKLPNYPRAYREYAYVTNGKSNTVSVLDLDTYHSIRTIPVGVNPTGVAANPTKNEVYVVNTGSNSVSVIDAETNKLTGTIGVEQNPYFIDVSRDGKRGYVANSGSNSVSVIDLDQHKVIRSISVGAAPGLARVSADGKIVVTSNRGDASVSVIDADRLEARSKKVAVCDQPTELAILSDASKVFVTCSGSGQVAVVALASPEAPSATESSEGTPDQKNAERVTRSATNGKRHTPEARSAPKNSDHLLVLLDVGKTPLHLALKPDGGEIFVSNFDSNTVSEVITNTNEVNGSYLIGKNPVRGLVSADNSTLYVTNFGSDSVGVYSIDDGKLLATVQVGSRPDAMALSPNQNFLFVVDTAAGDVAVVRAAELPFPVLLTMIPVGQQPNAIAVKAFISKKPPEP